MSAGLNGKYLKLYRDLCDAVEYGLKRAGTDDGGTCNFDSPYLVLPRWIEKNVIEAANKAGMGCFSIASRGGKMYVFPIRNVGQGYTRTNAAEAMTELLKERGYIAGTYYMMD